MNIKQITIVTLCSLGLVMAQRGDYRPGPKGGEKMRMMAVWKLTEHLDLKEDQADKFFPRYRSHEEKLKSIRKQQREILKPLKEKIRDGEEISAKEVSSAIDQLTKLEKQMVTDREDFVKGMKNILSPEQQLKLLTFRGEMMRDVKGKIRDRRKPLHRGGKKAPRH